MKRMLVAILAALSLSMLAFGALAQQPGRPFGPGPGGRQGAPDGRFQGFDGGRGEHRPREAVWPQRAVDGPGGPHGPGRMSPEERQQLRRDIDAHGRDIYRQERERQ